MVRDSADLRRDTLLVVDDTPETLGFLTDTLDSAGFTVLIATDGDGALRLMEQITPDLVVMDAMMPGVDGFETCRRIKRSKTSAHIPVVFMTGLTETEHVLEGLAAGGVDYVTKPIVVDELLARIRVHLANARVTAGTRAALDATGRFLLATDRSGRVLWSTPKARQLLAEVFCVAGEVTSVPPSLFTQLMQVRSQATNAQARLLVDVGGRKLEMSVMSPIGPDELLFRLTELSTTADEQRLQSLLALTTRESEVLLWISRGKANREIGEILAISPRTVNKHLEQIFVKLGVENRASAAARAIKALAR
jgi:DNA-binding response OmpR family regulator/DNA-binding CsgD family transcriptional regulator